MSGEPDHPTCGTCEGQGCHLDLATVEAIAAGGPKPPPCPTCAGTGLQPCNVRGCPLCVPKTVRRACARIDKHRHLQAAREARRSGPGKI